MIIKKTEVVQIMAHLSLSLCVLVAYLVVIMTTGEDNETLKSLTILAFGFWFGARRTTTETVKKAIEEQRIEQESKGE